MWHENVLGTIGNTPLVRITALARDVPCIVLAKVEFFNPGGSVKDRIGPALIEAAEREGRIRPGGTVIECTSGNTGAGLALAAIVKGYKCIFTTTDKQSAEKIAVLKALGAEVIVCPTAVRPEDPRSYYSVARRLAREIPNSFHVNQYDNPANTEAHYRITGPELWEQTGGRLTHFFLGAGTGGTISGTSRYLKEQNPKIKVIGVDPHGSVYYKYFHTREFDENEIYPYITEGVGEDILAGNMDFDLVDDYVRVTDKESMIMTRRLAREEGLFVGGSCGMACAGALQWLRAHRDELSDRDLAVVLLPDGGFRYLNKIYDDRWMQDHGFTDKEPALTAAIVVRGKPDQEHAVISVAPSMTLAEAVDRMAKHAISQVPVLENGNVVGSLEEAGILHLLIEQPDSRERLVGEVMGGPPKVVDPDTPIEELYSQLEQPPGVVLIATGEGDRYQVVTKADLITALAHRSDS
jgi:cystathionine beta-synthase